MVRLLLVRHGENPANLNHEFSCRKVDYSLTPKGLLQAEQTADALRGLAVADLWTSPLRRAAETAGVIGQALDLKPHRFEDLREMDVGDLEGWQPQAEAWQIYGSVMKRWLAGEASARLPGGESRTEITARFQRAVEAVAAAGPEDRTVVVVGHGGLFTHGVLALVPPKDEREFLGRENHNCSITTLDWDPSRGWNLVSWADTAHLRGEAAGLVPSVPEGVRVKDLR